jgi:hypothetical protein
LNSSSAERFVHQREWGVGERACDRWRICCRRRARGKVLREFRSPTSARAAASHRIPEDAGEIERQRTFATRAHGISVGD